MSRDNVLNSGDKILLYECKKNLLREFTISSVISDKGGSVVAYKAWYENGSIPGVLREFYPKDYEENLVRNAKTNGLCFENKDTPANYQKFVDDKNRYSFLYERMANIYQKGDKEYPFPFIPYFELFKANTENDIATIYIWTPADPVRTLKKVLQSIHSNPKMNSKYKIYTLLDGILNITNCIRILHSNNYIHRDISIDNVGFVMSGNRVMTQAVQLFDIDSICSNKDERLKKEFIYKEGFSENNNQIADEKPKLRDIYSIGACLFYAINTSEGDPKYRDSMYGDIDNVVESSKLFYNINDRNYYRIKEYIKVILKRCLSPYSKGSLPRFSLFDKEADDIARGFLRYDNIELLADDIEKALSQAESYERINATVSNKKWFVINPSMIKPFVKEIEENENKKKMALLYYLYKNPLYRLITDDGVKNRLNVLVLGMGRNSFYFLDTILQMVQNLEVNFSVEIIVNSVEKDPDIKSDADIYIKERPELTNFFSVINKDDVLSTYSEEDSYGSIEFKERKLTCVDDDGFIKTFGDLNELVSEDIDFVFVDVNDSLNEELAKNIKEAYYFTENVNVDRGDTKAISIQLADEFEKDEELLRLAYNAHIVWKDTLNIDFDKERQEFLKPYNKIASLSFAVSLKYKLKNFGIEMEFNTSKAANEFVKIEAEQRRIDRYAWMEHKRWVVEKICNGWTRMTVEECDLDNPNMVNGKDEDKKKHICIVKSKANRNLSSIKHDEWDSIDDELDELDELDCVSVKLHKIYSKKIQEQLRVDEIHILKKYCGKSEKLSLLYNNWQFSYKEMLRRINNRLMNTCDSSWKLLWEAIELDDDYEEAAIELKQIRNKLDCKKYEYKDFKEIDYNLVKKIPFILTYSEDKTLIVPIKSYLYYKKQIDNKPPALLVEKIYENVVVARRINPKNIYYVYYLRYNKRKHAKYYKKERKCVKEILSRILNFFDVRGLRTNVTFITLYDDNIDDANLSAYRKTIDNMIKSKENRTIKSICLCTSKRDNTCAESIKDCINELEEYRNIILQKPVDKKLRELYVSGLSYPSYKLNLMDNKIESLHKDCSWLTCIDVDNSLSAREINVLAGGSIEEYKDGIGFNDVDGTILLNIYRKNIDDWKSMCHVLKGERRYNLDDYREKIGVFDSRDKLDGEMMRRCMLPRYTYNVVVSIFSALEKRGFIKKYIISNDYMNNYISVEYHSTYNTSIKVKKMLSRDRSHFADVESIELEETPELTFYCYKYNIRAAKVKKYRKVIDELLDYGYVYGEKYENTYKNLKYAGKQVWDLFTSDSSEGTMLEYQTYYECNASGYFDNVISNLSIVPGGDFCFCTEVDCIVFKGAKMLLIECKARNSFNEGEEEEMFKKLNTRLEIFGFNAKGIVLIDGNVRIESAYNNITVKYLSEIEREYSKGYPIAEYINSELK